MLIEHGMNKLRSYWLDFRIYLFGSGRNGHGTIKFVIVEIGKPFRLENH